MPEERHLVLDKDSPMWAGLILGPTRVTLPDTRTLPHGWRIEIVSNGHPLGVYTHSGELVTNTSTHLMCLRIDDNSWRAWLTL
jgi:hypothetical protein